MNSTNLALEDFPFPPKKKVRISTIFEVRDLSPEAKEWNRVNNFSRKERNETLQNIIFDVEFIQYLETRRSTLTSKQYRNRIISRWQKREELLSDIRKLKAPSTKPHSPCPIKTILFFFNNKATNYRHPYYSDTTPYYKSFLYPI